MYDPRSWALHGTVPLVRRAAVILSAVAAVPLLSACGPAVTAAVGIGYDSSGRLIATLKVCDDAVQNVELQSYSPDEVLASWHRSSPLRTTEEWLLDDEAIGHWTRAGRATFSTAPSDEYTLWIEDDQHYLKGSTTFTVAALRQLKPGQLLVRRSDSTRSDPKDSTSRVIPREDMAEQECSY